MKTKLIFFLCFFLFASISWAEKVKFPNVAGTFYPASKEALSQQIEQFLQAAEKKEIPGEIVALISPHAGYIYSGPIAAYGYKAIAGLSYDTVVIVAPSHYLAFSGAAIYPEGAFFTPLGQVEVDSEMAEKILHSGAPVTAQTAAFAQEHALEVQLPFLQKTLVKFRIVPIITGQVSFADCQTLAKAIAEAADPRKKVLMVASSDLSHFHPYQEATLYDDLTLRKIKEFKPDEFFNYACSRGGAIAPCGFSAITIALLYAQLEKADQVQALKITNSGDTAGDKKRVVGYLSAVIYKSEKEKTSTNQPAVSQDQKNPQVKQKETFMLDQAQKKKLLNIARKSIETYLQSGKKLKISEQDPALLVPCGAFVTLRQKGELRGCIGNLTAATPLYQTILEMAVEAATGDPRFYPLSLNELKEVEIEISVLSPLKKVKSVDEIEMGKHGVLVRKGFNSGVFLPQVATETGWSKEEFLNHLCSGKAGLPEDAWRKGGMDIYIFTAEVFSEEEK